MTSDRWARARACVASRISDASAFAFVPTDIGLSRTRSVVFAFDTIRGFCDLQSPRSRDLGAVLRLVDEGRSRYTPSDCFETFPFPENWETDPALEAAGKAYYEFRAALMVRNNEGLTKTYNRFHDPDEHDPDIVKLRELHAAMDRAVLDAYGWTDIPTDCEFLLDYEIDEEEWGNKKKPWRYRWPDDVRDEVLARLLDSTPSARRRRRAPAPLRQRRAARKRPAKRAPKCIGHGGPFLMTARARSRRTRNLA